MLSARRPFFSLSPLAAASPPPLAGEVGPALPGREGEFERTIKSQGLQRPLPNPPPQAGEGKEKLLRRPQLRLHLVEQRLDLAVVEAGDVVLIFQKHAERVRHRRRVERDGV